MDNGDIMLV